MPRLFPRIHHQLLSCSSRAGQSRGLQSPSTQKYSHCTTLHMHCDLYFSSSRPVSVLASAAHPSLLLVDCSGIFIAGENPLWLIAARGTLLAHPADSKSPVTAMTPFNNINCPQVHGPSFNSQQCTHVRRLCMPLPMRDIPEKSLHALPLPFVDMMLAHACDKILKDLTLCCLT